MKKCQKRTFPREFQDFSSTFVEFPGCFSRPKTKDYPGLPRTFQDSGHPVIRMRSWNPEILGFWVVEKQSSAEWRKSKRSVSMPSRQIVLTLQVWSREHEAMWARIEPTIPMWTSSTDIEWSDNTCNGAWRNSDDVVFSDVIHDWRTLVMMITRK